MHRIGVFDSGIGGLTVLRQLRRAFPQLDMVYLGDTARVPYGGRSVETITHYAEDDVRFLLRKDVEAIVIGLRHGELQLARRAAAKSLTCRSTA